MHGYSRGGISTFGGGGGETDRYAANQYTSQTFQVGSTSPSRVNLGPHSRVINHESSYSTAKPTSPVARSDRYFPRSSIKQVRCGNRGSSSMEGSWHSRSSSEHSYLNQNFRPQVGFDESPTVFAFSPTTMSLHQQEEAFSAALTPTGQQQPQQLQTNGYFNGTLRQRTSRPNALNSSPPLSRAADNMYTQLSDMAKLQSKKMPQNTATFPRRGANFLNRSNEGVMQRMHVNGVEQNPFASDAETIKQRLLKEYQDNRLKMDMSYENSSMSDSCHYSIPSYYDKITKFQAGRTSDSGTLQRSQELPYFEKKRRQSGTVIIPSRSVDNCMTRSEYSERCA
ncbi:unnamed protein product [Rodentolepis nana]|uniref:Zasp-like motif domain-containing protein n=1 Tax=Rodentolepis nana TaxID=102285 RepID=A0A0R3TXY4_RODNA|nr:unnamed protein product [Rodentolepis nana]